MTHTAVQAIPDDVMELAREALNFPEDGAVMCIARAILADRARNAPDPAASPACGGEVAVEPIARKTFPVLNSDGQSIDYALVADHGAQAKKNHYQSVQRLAERGGLSWSELHAVLHNKKWERIDENEAILVCRSLENRYLAALASPEQGEVVRTLKTLIWAARTSGGTVGPDPELMAACENAEAALAKIGGGR